MIQQKIKELEKGCEGLINENCATKRCGYYCGWHREIHLCPICQAKLSVYKDAQKIFLDFLDFRISENDKFIHETGAYAIDNELRLIKSEVSNG